MRKDVLNQIKLIKEDINVLNKSELARRFNCDPRTIERYISGTSTDSRKPREIKTKIDDFKEAFLVKSYHSLEFSLFLGIYLRILYHFTNQKQHKQCLKPRNFQ